MTQTVYPAATGSRFEHSLGAMHLARRAWRAAWSNASAESVQQTFERAVNRDFPVSGVDFPELIEDVVGAVGLLHDLGHPPFSHVLESSFSDQAERAAWIGQERPRWVKIGAFHEFAGTVLLDQIIADLDSKKAGGQEDRFLLIVKAVYAADPSKRTWRGALHSIVAGEIDVDRLDYLMRDAQKAGTEFGAIDYERLVDALELHHRQGAFRIAPSVRARSAVETLLVQRAQSYRWITYHSRVVAVNLALARGVELVLGLARDRSAITIPGQDQVTVGELFAPLVPNLNYLGPGTKALDWVHGSAPEWVIDDDQQTRQLRRFGRELQSAVDDAGIIHMLQRATALAMLLQDLEISEELAGRLARLRTYGRAVLIRQRNFVSAWKTIDEFTRAVDRFRAPSNEDDREDREGDLHDERLAEAISAVYSQVIEDLAAEGEGRASQIKALEHEREVRLARLARNPAAEINDIFSTLLSEPGPRQDRLRELLQDAETQFKPEEGFWQVAFASFKPVETDETFSVLYDGSVERSVLRTSPLVNALREVEHSRVRLFIYFFVTTPDLARWRRENVESARGSLIGAFFQTFPLFLQAVWPDFIKLSLSDPNR